MLPPPIPAPVLSPIVVEPVLARNDGKYVGREHRKSEDVGDVEVLPLLSRLRIRNDVADSGGLRTGDNWGERCTGDNKIGFTFACGDSDSFTTATGDSSNFISDFFKSTSSSFNRTRLKWRLNLVSLIIFGDKIIGSDGDVGR